VPSSVVNNGDGSYTVGYTATLPEGKSEGQLELYVWVNGELAYTGANGTLAVQGRATATAGKAPGQQLDPIPLSIVRPEAGAGRTKFSPGCGVGHQERGGRGARVWVPHGSG